MSGSKDGKQDHGSHESQPAQGRDGSDGGHSGHGSASALERFYSQRREWQQGGGDDAHGTQ
jgi:hypothetical protein